ncbi:aspartate aminotransferase family protein [Acuticoccus kandeliae]|uniref:aspartate aminotransferase family protein n=1 Tax=Acuticoccus kandeliae TaxID=2073160 RepID=UPI000D3E02FA|nr:aspartate aminotransferase family protein [Acuticoccus kandeliae]
MSSLLHRVVAEQPPIARKGARLVIKGADGREVIDGSGGAAVACVGHGHPKVIAAITEALGDIAYAHTGIYSNAPAEALAAHLVARAPEALTAAYFVSSGSEATEAALKLARQFMVETGEGQRDHFIARRQSYHGNTLGALAVGGHVGRRAPYEPILNQKVRLVSPCYAYRGQRAGETVEAYRTRLLDEIEATFQEVGPDRVIAFIAEPVVGATLGAVGAMPHYFEGVAEICRRHGALLILDEVMCGLGRMGERHAFEADHVVPDISVIAKGLGGGYQPIGGLLIHERIVAALRGGSGVHAHGHTYSAHPIACAAALAVQQVVEEENLIENVRTVGKILTARLHETFGDHPHVGDIRGRGFFQAVELVADRETKTPFAPGLKLADRVKHHAYLHGLACYPSAGTVDGRMGDHVLLAPPYIATEDDVATIVARMAAGIEDAIKAAKTAAG